MSCSLARIAMCGIFQKPQRQIVHSCVGGVCGVDGRYIECVLFGAMLQWTRQRAVRHDTCTCDGKLIDFVMIMHEMVVVSMNWGSQRIGGILE